MRGKQPGTDSGRAAVCPECEGRLRPVGVQTICEDCGLVAAEDPIDRGPEWRSFADDDTDRRRTGAPLTRSRHDRGLSSEIGYGYGSRLRVSGRKRRRIARMRKEHNRARLSSKRARNQKYAFTEIRRIVAQHALPVDLCEQACTLFTSAQSNDLLTGRSVEGFAAAAVYTTCRTRSLPRTIDEIVTVARASESELKVAYDALNRELGLQTGPIDPADYLPRYATKLDLGTAAERDAREYVEALLEAGALCGRNPSGAAAACLYLAATTRDDCEPITQAAAADVAGVSTATIQSTVSLLSP
ncbi:transcription initiation factor IIB [Natrononativus amylolyticus]|uniref:transcription initiation factor IIB n=1 Tax=Natrononativus amylolyticus TaxID=2963434 RepID=UPI0020CCCDBF|nr:transcription initiation factor IIB family protein [Natrononativus amylolyticus]